MGKDRADTPPLRDPLSPLDEGPILRLHRGLKPPCPLQEDPWTGRLLAERPQEQRLIKVVKASFAVEIPHPGQAPASLPGHAQGLMGRLPRAVALRVRGKHGLKHRFPRPGDYRLRKTIRHGRHSSQPLTPVTLGEGYRPHRRRTVPPRRQAMPELREVIRQRLRKVGARCRIDACRALVRLPPFLGVPHHPLGNIDRLCSLHWCLPWLGDQPSKLHDTPPALHPHYRGFHTTTGWSAPVPCLGTLTLRGLPLAFLPCHQGDRFPRSTHTPGSPSRHLYAGRRSGRKQVPPALLLAERLAPVLPSSLRCRHLRNGALALVSVIRT
jgi:hypothetical protein